MISIQYKTWAGADCELGGLVSVSVAGRVQLTSGCRCRPWSGWTCECGCGWTCPVDVRLPFNVEELLQNVFIVLASVFMIVVSYPWLLLALLGLVVVFVIIQRIASVVTREVCLLVSFSRPYGQLYSPVCSNIFIHQTSCRNSQQ